MLKFRQNTIINFLKKFYSHIEYTLLACTQFFTINLKHGLIFPGIKLELNFKLYYTILNFFRIFIWSFSWIILCSCSASLSVAKPSETSDFCSTCDGSGSRFSPRHLGFLARPLSPWMCLLFLVTSWLSQFPPHNPDFNLCPFRGWDGTSLASWPSQSSDFVLMRSLYLSSMTLVFQNFASANSHARTLGS